MIKPKFLPCLLLSMLGLCSGEGFAASLRFSPITFNFSEQQRNDVLTILNQSSEATTLQARVFEWTQDNGQDILTPSNDIAISPAIQTLAAATSYNFRVVRVNRSPVQQEKSYRLILDELPKPVDARKNQQGLTVLLRSALPVFITNKDAMQELSWQFEHSAEQTLVTIRNAGGRHAKFTELILLDQTSNLEYPIKVDTINGYILHGQQRSYRIEDKKFIYQSQHKYSLKSVVNRKALQF
jgi:fimbrial chaperone protein